MHLFNKMIFQANKKSIQYLYEGPQCQQSAKLNRVHAVIQDKDKQLSDNTILFHGYFPSNQKTRTKHLSIRSSEYIIHNWSQQGFPAVLYLSLDGYGMGYKDRFMKSTDKVAALQLTQINSVDKTGITNHALKYELKETITWQIPVEFNLFTFRLSTQACDQSFAQLPLPSPLLLNFQIRIQ